MNEVITSQVFPSSVLNSKRYLLLFLLWPFLAFITALANYSQREARKVVYFFLIYYGCSYVINATGYYVDAVGYVLELKANAQLPFSDFFKIVGGLYSVDDSTDIYEPLVSFVVSRFTDNYRVLFAVFSAIFGFFYLKSINILFNLYRQNPGPNALVNLIFFSLIIPVTAINGVRMWTAAWIFFYGAIHVIWYRDARYLLLALSSSLVHFSFLTANIFLVIYFFAGNRNFFYLPLALASFVLPQLLSPFIQMMSLKLGGSIQNRYMGYTSEGYMSRIQEGYNQSDWFIQIGNDLVFYYLIFTLVIIQIVYRGLMKGEKEKNLFSFLLLFLSFVNFGSTIPTLGGRFQLVFFLFATLYIFLFFLRISGPKINILTLIGLFPMLLYAAVTLRIGSISINAWIFTPGFGLPFFIPGLSVTELLFN